ncbi:4Fe-4S dicluster domain-containing protein [Kineothrix sp. MB12-C1]|uniref:4Fe-4S dicluster domain-containing protein n=1 Tax=Kineothrix sp. MB12-C1 TaxID=3070215 RepID=UPI0027D28A90|nr:4Fe-4S dicluster domain-containing protein [Kineothrix sp. MB12-C1]WMC92741.1 4Fe-4S dicluster domain-containing protein [Kineothrix sp. MB12-C1]
MRGIDTQVRKIRRRIFKEVSNLAYHSTDLINDVEALPYKIVDYDESPYGNVYRERAVVREMIRLAMGLSLRPEDAPVHVTQGLAESDIDEKYYEPPLMQVIPSACNACPENRYEVTDKCMGCLAHPCREVCPKEAVSMRNGKSVIDQEKCIKCGKCKAVCPYDAISHQTRPCLDACGVNAIKNDYRGRALIDNDLCVSCGQCMVSCPFGAIADKSQIFQLIRAMQSGRKIVAQVAPAFVGQFGPKVSPDRIKASLKELGFYDIYETAIGADMGAMAEAEHYVHEVATGELPFLLTSCCPSWSMLAKKFFPETIDKISNALTPMVATARKIKEDHPDASVVFIGPCASKKLEASRRTVRSDVDFVITFEELAGMFEAKGIDLNEFSEMDKMEDATGAGRGYGVAGGVASAIEECIREYYPDTEVKIEHAESLTECKKMLMLAKAGKKNGCLIEGMACPGGCIAGAGTNIAIPQAAKEVAGFKAAAAKKIPDKE